MGAAALLVPGRASADLVYLTSGKAVSVKSLRMDGDTAVLQLRGGGEMSCAASLIARVAPDEVPYPEPVVERSTEAETVLAARDGESAAGSAGRPYQIAASQSYQMAASRPYLSLVEEASRRHRVDPRLVHAVITVESRYRPRARSRKGAMGLMQLMPATARELEVSDPYDPAANVEGGVRHLRALLDRFDVRLAVAAYNAGAAAVVKFRGIPPYRETQAYVRQVLALAGLPSSPW